MKGEPAKFSQATWVNKSQQGFPLTERLRELISRHLLQCRQPFGKTESKQSFSLTALTSEKPASLRG
jgi:hypothetical protein